MYRTIVAVAFLSWLLTGCNREPPVPATHSYDLFGGRFFVDIETVGSFSISNNVKNGEQGGEKWELAEYKWGENTLRLDMGKLTFNGKDYGTLKQGDRVRVDKDNRLYINGAPQP
jgi:hypothetical protein